MKRQPQKTLIFGFKGTQVRLIHVENADSKMVAQVAQDLEKNEGNPKNFIIANFNQKAFTDDADVGHISVVGAYDAKTKRVLIFDVDREYYEPYWVGLETFVQGMATSDSSAKQNRGYLFIALE